MIFKTVECKVAEGVICDTYLEMKYREESRGREREMMGEFQEKFIYGNRHFSIEIGICTFQINVTFLRN